MADRLYVRRGAAFSGTLTVYVDGAEDATTTSGTAFVAALRTQRGQTIRTLTAAAGTGAGTIGFEDGNGTASWPVGVSFLHVSWIDSAGNDRALYPPIEIETVDADEIHEVDIASAAWRLRGQSSDGSIARLSGLGGGGGTAASGGGGGGLLFELDTTSATDIETTTEVQGKTAPSGTAFAGTVTPTGNVSAPWDSATKTLKITTSGAMVGIGLRRVLCGTLPAAGFILDVGIGDLDVLTNTRLVIALYEQRAGTNGRGIGIGIQSGMAQLDVIGFADDGADSPAVNTSPITFMSADSWGAAPGTFDRGPSRVILEFRKVDASSPERWLLRATLIGPSGSITSQTYSGIAYPATGWSTSLDLAGASMTRIALGAWCVATEGGDMSISHLRIYSLGSSVPA